ncbi:DUF742 domain-containing protein [Haloechinothrix salitolerans]
MTDPDDSEHLAAQEEAVVVDTSDSSTVGAADAELPVQATARQPRVPGRAVASGGGNRSHQEDETALVRPYMLTGGRTKASYALELETLISAKNGVLSESAPMRIEQRSIVEACSSPRSVAEIAVDLRMPLGVARVLVSDAADAGLVNVHNTVSGADGAEAHLLLMERVLSGLRRL